MILIDRFERHINEFAPVKRNIILILKSEYMKANKPSYDELENQLVDLKEELVRLSLLLKGTENEQKVVLDNLEGEESVGYKSLNSALIESVLNKVKTPLDTIVGLSKLLSTVKLDFEEKIIWLKLLRIVPMKYKAFFRNL